MSDFYTKIKETAKRNKAWMEKPNFWLKMLRKEKMENEIIKRSDEEMAVLDEEMAAVEVLKDPLRFEFGGYSFKSVSAEDGLHDAERNDGALCQIKIESGELKKIVYK